jgi:uncharacterized repeat protein (TIGR03803 family)
MFTMIYSFPSGTPPGWYAQPLFLGGAVYGLSTGTHGSGSIVRVNADGTGLTTLRNFPPTVSNGTSASTNSDGASPLGGVISDSDTLYGTASSGGLLGFGTVFSLKTNGTGFTVLRHFAGRPDGKAPYGELLLVGSVLYGTTAAGGDFGKGTVFQINTDGSGFNILKSFAGSDGMLPFSGLTLSEGVLYGTTSSGGAWTNGTVFSINLDGSGFTTLKEFNAQEGASGPRYPLVVSGNWIYGTTEGNWNGPQSVVYRLSTDGAQYDVLKTFSTPDPVSGTNDDGSFTQSGLVACGGTLFGSTRVGGYYASGVVFALRMDGSGYTVLKHFPVETPNGLGGYVNTDGAEPGPLTRSGASLYGTPKHGGAAGVGTLFSVNFSPRIQLDTPAVGAGSFGFNIYGFSNQVVSVEATAQLVPPAWVSLATITLAGGQVHFLDAASTNYPQRLYRLQAQ